MGKKKSSPKPASAADDAPEPETHRARYRKKTGILKWVPQTEHTTRGKLTRDEEAFIGRTLRYEKTDAKLTEEEQDRSDRALELGAAERLDAVRRFELTLFRLKGRNKTAHRLYVLAFEERATYAAIAEEFCCSPDAVRRTMIPRLVRMIRLLYEAYYGEMPDAAFPQQSG